MVLDIQDFALRLAERMGALAVVNSKTQVLYQGIRQEFEPRRPDIVIESAGSSATQAQAFELARPGGRLIMISISMEMMGGEVCITINWESTADKLIETNPPIVYRLLTLCRNR